MKLNKLFTNLAVAAALIFSFSPLRAGETVKAAPADQDISKVSAQDISGLKDILYKLVRQDESLDEAIEKLDGAEGPVTARDLAGIKASLVTVRKNLDHISWLNKKHFTEVSPGSETEKYTRTILSYSAKINRKAAAIGTLAARAVSAAKKSGLRDAPSSRKGKKAAKGKSLDRILAEKKAWASLAAETRTLRGASYKLKATSRWLHVAAK